ncbi:hypothetical protein [Streptomyces sp. C10]|uniref:hypothetical protein n=1 Tax=Streptomyces sp. C10 TaxID=531941 RepID=UPI00397FB631
MLVAGWLPLAAGAGAVIAIQVGQTSLARFADVTHLVNEYAMWGSDLLVFQDVQQPAFVRRMRRHRAGRP